MMYSAAMPMAANGFSMQSFAFASAPYPVYQSSMPMHIPHAPPAATMSTPMSSASQQQQQQQPQQESQRSRASLWTSEEDELVSRLVSEHGGSEEELQVQNAHRQK